MGWDGTCVLRLLETVLLNTRYGAMYGIVRRNHCLAPGITSHHITSVDGEDIDIVRS